MLSWFQRPKAVDGGETAATEAPPPEPGAVRPDMLDEFPEPLDGIGNFDLPRGDDFEFEPGEEALLAEVAAAVAKGEFDLPLIPSTHIALLDLTSDPDADVGKMDRLISTDVALTAALLKTANSVLYAGTRRAETVRGAVLRVGLRGLRSVLLSLSVRSVLFKTNELAPLAEEVWRQSQSVATNARALAVPLGLDPERYYVLGLLHDVGKVPLLDILRRLAPRDRELRAPFIGLVFDRYHEEVGGKLAAAWNLPEEIVSVAGCHHDFERNETHRRSAALVHLAHAQDLFLSSGRPSEYAALATSAAMAELGLAAPMRTGLLDAVRNAYVQRLRDAAVA